MGAEVLTTTSEYELEVGVKRAAAHGVIDTRGGINVIVQKRLEWFAIRPGLDRHVAQMRVRPTRGGEFRRLSHAVLRRREDFNRGANRRRRRDDHRLVG